MATTTRRAALPQRLFVPLASEPFDWFADGSKRWELRRYGRQYTEKHLRVGRRVELRRGYGHGRSLWGVITRVHRAPSLEDFLRTVDYREVLPTAESMDAARQRASEILRTSGTDAVIGFEIRLD